MLIWQMVLIQAATFALIVLCLRWLLYSHVSRALKKLHKLNQQNLAREKALKEELERAKKQAEGEISRGKSEARALKEKVKIESENEAGRLLENARKEAKKIVEEGIRESHIKMHELVMQMQEKTAYLASDAIRHILTESTQKCLQSGLIDELIGEIKNIPPKNMKVEEASVEVVSAFDMDSKQKSKLRETVCSKLGKEVCLSCKTDKEIIAGIILKSGGFVIDGSIRNKLKKILPLMKEQAREEG